MFSKITLHNFESFSDLEFKIEGKKNEPLKMAMVFGENGAGKTNLIDSVRFLKSTAATFTSGVEKIDPEQRALMLEIISDSEVPEGTRNALRGFLDAALDDYSSFKQNIIDIAKDCIMVGSEGGMSVGYTFFVDGKRTEYSMRFDEQGNLIRETMRSSMGVRLGTYFEISAGQKISYKFANQLFRDDGFSAEMGKLIDRYWGKHSFLSILNDQYRAKNAQFMNGAVGLEMGRIAEYISGIMVNIFDEGSEIWPFDLGEGAVQASRRSDLDRYSDALDEFFTTVCSDIRGVHYETEEKKGIITYSLMFDRMIGGKIRRMPYSKESSGIRKLCRLFPLLTGSADRRVIFLDELDSNIHDRMVTELIAKMAPYINGQLVFTTHNTGLLKDADPKSAFIIVIDGEGCKTITPISGITKTQANHNNTVRYLNGVFSGVPYVGYLDMPSIVSKMNGDGDGKR